MFNGLFGPNPEHGGGGGFCGLGNCTWIILILIFCCCCGGGGKWRPFCLTINPCCLLLWLGLLYCTGTVSLGCHPRES